MRSVLFVVFIVLSVFKGKAQSADDSLRMQPYSGRILALYRYYSANHKAADIHTLKQRIAHVRTLAETHHDEELQLEADFMQALAWNYALYHQPQQSVQALKALAVKAKQQGADILLPKIYRRLAELYWNDLHNYELAYEAFNLMLEAQRHFSNAECPDIGQNFGTIGEFYFFFKDYRQCIAYMDSCLQCSPHPFSDKSKNKARNAMGLSYQVSGQLDSADHYFQLILTAQEPFKLEEWKGIAKGNLAGSAIRRGQFTRAIPWLWENVQVSIRAKDTSLLGHCYTSLVRCYVELNQKKTADSCLERARFFTTCSRQPHRLAALYEVMTRYHLVYGSPQEARRWFDSTLLLRDQLEKTYNSTQLLRVNQKLEHARRVKLEHEKANKIKQRNFSVVLLLFGLFVALYVYFNQKKKFQQKREIDSLKLKQVNQELETASRQLEFFTRSLSEKSILVDELEQKLGHQLNEEAVAQLQQHTILTDADWDHFRNLFNQVHKGFLVRLKEKMPELTPAEIRFMTLAKLNLSTKEMAASLGVSAQSVRVTRHRLLKKINLPEDGSLADLVNSI